MMNNNVNNDKKKSLLAYKEKILEEIKYYETRIEDFRANHNKNNSYRDEDDSSDSDDELLQMIDNGPSIAQLKLKQEVMKTCLLATQELTSLTVLQSQVNVLVDAPDIDREKPITEPGLWIEVTAECEIDLVNFTIHFYMHKPYRTFAPPSYRCLRVEPVRDSDKLELDKSVLHSLKLPSDAVEVMKSYNAASRSRRTTLSKLDKKFANSLIMEKHPEGGYTFKCSGLLEVCWRLENKWSPVAPFHHRMKFDLEYMDESYIKIITQAHKQLLDPSLQTDERTLLLSKIISTCLEAKGPVDTESDLESKTEKDEFEKRDSEVMAPPKSLPKKSKSKDTKKRSFSEDGNTVKRLKSNDFEDLNSMKSKIVDEFTSVVKKMRVNDGVASAKNVEITDDENIKRKSPKDGNIDDKIDETKKKTKNFNAEVKNTNSKIKNKIAKDSADIEEKASNTITKNVQKESAIEDNDGNIPNNKDMTEPETNKDKNGNTKPKNQIAKNSGAKAVKKLMVKPKKIVNEVIGDETSNTKPKTKSPIDTGNTENINNKPKNTVNENIGEKNDKNIAKTKNTVNENKENNNDNTIAKKKSPKDIGKPKNIENGITDEKTSNPKPKNKTAQNDGNTEQNKVIKTKPKITKEPSNLEKAVNKPKNTQKETGNTAKDNVKTKAKITEIKENNVASTKNDEDKNNDNMAKDVDRQRKVVKTKTNIAITKKPNSDLNKAVNNKKSVATKNVDQEKKNTDINTKNKENADVLNKANKKIKDIPKDGAIINKTTQKNATNRIKDKILSITKKVPEKNVQDKQTNIIKSNIKTVITNPIKKTSEPKMKIMQKLSSHRNSIKPNNKVLKASNTGIKTGNTDKDGAKIKSKIPQKKLSPISESLSKKNPLRISPRQMPTKFKSTVDVMKQKVIKATSIPRLMKDSLPKRTQ